MRVSIVGCGWLGLPLAESLMAAGHRIYGTTTHADKLPMLEARGIDARLLHLAPAMPADAPLEIFASDALVINIPPGRKRDDAAEFHVSQMEAILPYIQDTRPAHVVYVSSTSVYGDVDGEVREEDAGQPSGTGGVAVWVAEELLRDRIGPKLTVIRLGGLLGGDRHPVNMLARRSEVSDGDQVINLTAQDDAVRGIALVLERRPLGGTFNLCCSEHPTRREYYTREAAKFGLNAPNFTAGGKSGGKRVSSKKIERELGYRFVYSSPFDIFSGDQSSYKS